MRVALPNLFIILIPGFWGVASGSAPSQNYPARNDFPDMSALDYVLTQVQLLKEKS